MNLRSQLRVQHHSVLTSALPWRKWASMSQPERSRMSFSVCSSQDYNSVGFCHTKAQEIIPREYFQAQGATLDAFWSLDINKDEIEEVDLAAQSHYMQPEKQVEAVMIKFLKNLGLSSILSTRITKKSDQFVNHLVALLHTRYRSCKPKGRALSVNEIEAALVPYLEALAAEHKDRIIDVLVSFPNRPPLKQQNHENFQSPIFAKREGGGNYVLTLRGNYRPSVVYALSIGLSLTEVRNVVKKCPSFLSYNPERKIKPVVSYLIAMGLTRMDILKVLSKSPEIFGCDLECFLKPTVAFLESIGLQRSQYSKIIVRCPTVLGNGREKLREFVDFFESIGFTCTEVGCMVSKLPHVIGLSVEDKLYPTVEFLRKIGFEDVGSFLKRSPEILNYSIDGNIKPTIMFLLEIGYEPADVILIINRFPEILGLAIGTDVRPKWEYYLWTGWPKSHLVTFPQYFGYSLERVIKPRFEKVLKNGVMWKLGRILSSSEKEFDRLMRNEERPETWDD